MSKTTENKYPPFKTFIDNYEALLQQMQGSTSQSEINKLTKDIHQTLKQLFKSMMTYYEKQHQKNLEFIESNKQHLSSISQKALDRSQTILDRTVKQSQDIMEKQMAFLKQAYRMQPQEFLDSVLEHTSETFDAQNKAWESIYHQQKDEMEEDLQAFEAEAKKMLKHTETLRQDMLTIFHELEERFHKALAQKNGQKH